MRHKAPSNEGHCDDQGLLVADGQLDLPARASVHRRLWHSCYGMKWSYLDRVWRRYCPRSTRGRLTVGLFAICCLQSVDGDRVLVAVHDKHVVFLVSLEDLERPIIGALQRTAMGIVVNIHPAGGSQVVGLVGRKSTVELMCGWEDRARVVL